MKSLFSLSTLFSSESDIRFLVLSGRPGIATTGSRGTKKSVRGVNVSSSHHGYHFVLTLARQGITEQAHFFSHGACGSSSCLLALVFTWTLQLWHLLPMFLACRGAALTLTLPRGTPCTLSQPPVATAQEVSKPQYPQLCVCEA